MDLKQVSEFEWEMPKSKGMNVPAKIYASKELLTIINQDRTLEQLKNMACLPGIQKYALALPDAHQGYGFCCHPKTRVLTSLGFNLSIKDFQKIWKLQNIKVLDTKSRSVADAFIKKFLKIKPDNKVFKLVTKSGDEIIATADHPFYTKKGMVALEKLDKNDEVAVFPFEGVPYTKPSGKMIISEEDVKKTLSELGRKPGEAGFEQNIRALKKRNLLKLNYRHPKIPYLIKIMGFVFGDGTMNFYGKKGDGVIHFAGKAEDLEIIREDIKKIGYTPSKVYSQTSKIMYKGDERKYANHNFYVNASSLLILLKTLGQPIGSKVFQKYRIPKWVIKAPLWQKRLFLASFFGAELRRPHRRKGRVSMFNCPVLSMNKSEKLISNCRTFLKDVSGMLKEFGVKTIKINKRKKHVNVKGNITWHLELIFSSKTESLIKLWSKIGFEYNNERSFQANAAVQYLKYKQRILKEKEEAIKIIIPNLLKTGLSYQKIAQKIASPNPLTERFVESVCLKIKKGVKNIQPRVPKNFMTFSEYSERKTENLGSSGAVWEVIAEKKEIQYKGLVYDFTVLHEAHNFIGNCFIISNCIGGVAALSTETGGISPGGVGFDINCLHPETKILTDLGCSINIKDLTNNNIVADNNSFLMNKVTQKFYAITYDNKLTASRIKYAMKRSTDKKILNIRTFLGRNIKCSEDHPILTINGMVKSKELKQGDKVLISPFTGVGYEELGDNELARGENFKGQLKNELIKRGLLPFKESNPKMPYIARIIGYLMGDGTIYYSGIKGYVNFYGEAEDLRKIQEDLKIIGYNSGIYSRTRNHKIKTRYADVEFTAENHELHCGSKSLAKLLEALGTPVGNKTRQDFLIPEWIIKSKKWIKRLFLSGFFSAELSKPKMMNKYNFYTPMLSQNKTGECIESCHKMFEQMTDMLEEFRIRVNKISLRKDYEYENKHGEKTYRLRLIIAGDSGNLISLYSKIGFDYNQKRQKLGMLATNYLLYKESIISYREELEKQSKILKKKGLSIKEIVKELNSEIINKRFIERSVCNGRKGRPRVHEGFITFDEFSRITHFYQGIVRDEIVSIEEEDYAGFLYDINVDNEEHNFVADSFIVSNCGIRVMKTNLEADEVMPRMKELINELFSKVPSGLGSKGALNLKRDELKELMEKGMDYMLNKGLAVKNDLLNCEDNGRLKEASADKVSDKALGRGMSQVGSLGSGNHFIDIHRVDKIFDKGEARKHGLFSNQVLVMIHCGSRGLGHQIASDYLRTIEKKYPAIMKSLPDRDLAYAPAGSDLADDYFKAMSAAANYAWCNRQLIMHNVRKVFEKFFDNSGKSLGLELFYDVCHNIAKIEKHDGVECYVHRKGATKSFPGEKVIIPGSMGTNSYLLIGGKDSMSKSFGSTAHGAGRLMSRAKANRTYTQNQVMELMSGKGILLKSATRQGASEEAPGVYKDVDEVVRVIKGLNIAKPIIGLKPLAVING